MNFQQHIPPIFQIFLKINFQQDIPPLFQIFLKINFQQDIPASFVSYCWSGVSSAGIMWISLCPICFSMSIHWFNSWLTLSCKDLYHRLCCPPLQGIYEVHLYMEVQQSTWGILPLVGLWLSSLVSHLPVSWFVLQFDPYRCPPVLGFHPMKIKAWLLFTIY